MMAITEEHSCFADEDNSFALQEFDSAEHYKKE